MRNEAQEARGVSERGRGAAYRKAGRSIVRQGGRSTIQSCRMRREQREVEKLWSEECGNIEKMFAKTLTVFEMVK